MSVAIIADVLHIVQLNPLSPAGLIPFMQVNVYKLLFSKCFLPGLH